MSSSASQSWRSATLEVNHVAALAADYEALKVVELRVICGERGLPQIGRKAELIARLVEADGCEAKTILKSGKRSEVDSGVGDIGSGKSEVPATSPRKKARTLAGRDEAEAEMQDDGLAMRMRDLSVAFVCHSNLNRSVEAHHLCKTAGYTVASFGAGNRVNLPGETKSSPNIYDFGTDYQFIHDDLERLNADLFERNGVLDMLRRNIEVKKAPERWQESVDHYDVIICFEERIFDLVINDLLQRPAGPRLTHVVNVETVDSHAAAKVGAQYAKKLLDELVSVENWEDNVHAVLDRMESQSSKPIHYSQIFY